MAVDDGCGEVDQLTAADTQVLAQLLERAQLSALVRYQHPKMLSLAVVVTRAHEGNSRISRRSQQTSRLPAGGV